VRVLRIPLTLLSPPGARGRLSILIFHRVLAQPDPLFPSEPDAEMFTEQMQWVREWFNVIPLAWAVELLYAGGLPARALSITFDDGYADNAEVAAPILKRLGLSATFFVATGFLNGGCMFNDQIIEAIRKCQSDHLDLTLIGLGKFSLESADARRSSMMAVLNGIRHRKPEDRAAAVDAVVQAAGADAPPALMMSPAQVQRLSALGMDVGAHTVSHPILTRLDSAAARLEIVESKAQLDRLLGRSVTLFAYPNGVPQQDYAAEHVQMVRDAGFTAAVATAWGAASAHSDRFQLPRFTPWDRGRLRYGARLILNLSRRQVAAV
jgi:peptidoglycan/xylan/chitin deacetylase (PgdA/CDA1 family)